MGKKNASKIVTSNISSAANPAASSTTLTAATSSILKSSFAPSHLHLPLFASVIQGLDSQHIRFHDTTTGRLQCEHAIGSRASVSCLDWGYYGQKAAPSNKKRKRLDALNGISSKGSSHDVVLAVGLSDSSVQLYSPIEAKVVAVLANAHTGGIRDFKFVIDGVNDHAWSLGGDTKLVQWDLKEFQPLKTLNVPSGSVNSICPKTTSILCASHLAYMMTPDVERTVPSFNASTNAVHTILNNQFAPENATQFLTIAKVDHSISVFTEDSPTLTGSLRTENEILSASIWNASDQSAKLDSESSIGMRRPHQVLAALNKDGLLEIFPLPFTFEVPSGSDGQSLKARMKQRSRTSAAQIRIVGPEKDAAKLPLIGGAFEDDHIVLAWVERGVNINFDRLPWRDADTGNMLLNGVTDVVKAKSGGGLGAVTMNGVKDMGKSHVDDSRTVIGNGVDMEDTAMKDGPTQPETIEISSDEEDSVSDKDGSQLQPPAPISHAENVERNADGPVGEEVDMLDDRKPSGLEGSTKDVEDATSDALLEDTEEPTFGELLQAKGEATIDVPATLNDTNTHSLVPNQSTSVQTLPSGMSLGTVLTQSLRTNDTTLLETCLHTRDLSIVRATIERLESHFAATLLQKLAERLHNRPGRAGRLMVWIQWTLVAHGGYLAGQPEAMRRLRGLHKVVRERASSLQHLLALKGKLDMLDAQMNLRKSMMEQGRRSNIAEEDDDEEGVIYVEGQDEEEEKELDDEDEDEDDSSDDSSESDSRAGPNAHMNKDSDDEMPTTTTTNGILAAEEEDEDDEEGSASDDALIDNEASSTDQDSDEGLSLDDDEIDHESVDTDSSDADDASAASPPPPKRPVPAKTRTSNGISARGR